MFDGKNLFISSNSLFEYVIETSFPFIKDYGEDNKDRLEGVNKEDEITIYDLYDIIYPNISSMFIKRDGIDYESYSFIKPCKCLYFGWDKIDNKRIDILIKDIDEIIWKDGEVNEIVVDRRRTIRY